jgi:hypothetical protein
MHAHANDTSFTVKAEEILHKFGMNSGLEFNWHKSVAYWCGRGRPPIWMGKYYWKYVATGNLSKLLGTPFGLKLKLQEVDQCLIYMVKGKLKYWISTNLSLVVWVGSKKVLGRIKALLRNYLWSGTESTTRARVSWDDCTCPRK